MISGKIFSKKNRSLNNFKSSKKLNKSFQEEMQENEKYLKEHDYEKDSLDEEELSGEEFFFGVIKIISASIIILFIATIVTDLVKSTADKAEIQVNFDLKDQAMNLNTTANQISSSFTNIEIILIILPIMILICFVSYSMSLFNRGP